MNSVTREEFDTKMEAMQFRVDGQIAAIAAKIDHFADVLGERFTRLEERITSLEGRVTSLEARITSLDGRVTSLEARATGIEVGLVRVETMVSETRTSVRNLKVTVIVTAISATLAIIFGVAAALANMNATFESGKSSGAAQAEVNRRIEENAALLRQIQRSLPQAPAAPDRPPRK